MYIHLYLCLVVCWAPHSLSPSPSPEWDEVGKGDACRKLRDTRLTGHRLEACILQGSRQRTGFDFCRAYGRPARDIARHLSNPVLQSHWNWIQFLGGLPSTVPMRLEAAGGRHREVRALAPVLAFGKRDFGGYMLITNSKILKSSCLTG